MTKQAATPTTSNSSNRSGSGRRSKSPSGRRNKSPGRRSKSPQFRSDNNNADHKSGSSNSHRSASGNHNHKHPAAKSKRRPDAVVFPPDPHETGEEVVNRVLEAFGFSDQFPPDCQQQVADILAQERHNPWKKETKEDAYVDHTHLPYITIDGPTTQDLDQAMYITRQNLPGRNAAVRIDHTQSTAQAPNGYLVSYALADGAHFVPAQSPLFQYALQRGGTSFYLPGKVIPMLPRALSEGVMSLLPNVKRRALIFDIYLNAEGHPLKTFYQWGYIQSRWKGTYGEVSDYYDAIDSGATNHSLLGHQYTETIDLLREVGILRRQIASERHVVEFPKHHCVGVVVNKNTGKLFLGRRNATKSPAELYNEQISLLCNSEGAKLLHFQADLEQKTHKKDIIHPIYRSQKEPSSEQMAALQQVIETTLTAHAIDATTYGWSDGEESIAEYLERIRKRRDSYTPLCPESRVWSAIVQVVERQAMATNLAATLSTTSSAHFGLKMDYYARFSSPMRELVGCYTHKELWEAHTGKLSGTLTSQGDAELREQVIRAARRAHFLQKKLSGTLFLHMMNLVFYRDLKKPLTKRPLRRGVLMGLNFSEERCKSRRCYVQLEDDPAIEIKVFCQDLEYFYNCRYVVLKNTDDDNNQSTEEAASSVAIAIGPLAGSFKEDVDDQERPPIFKVGQRVTIRVADYAQFYGQTSRSRWCFIMDLDELEEQADVTQLNRSVSRRRNSVLRNSILDIDLFSERDSASVASGVTEDSVDYGELKEIMDEDTYLACEVWNGMNE